MAPYEYRVPKIVSAVYITADTSYEVCSSDTIYFDGNTNSYYSKEQYHKIKKLEEELAKKKETDKNSLKSLIAYFYKDRK